MPNLTFFCELETDQLHSLFATPGLLEQLRSLRATVSLSILDLTAERAAVVRQLNAAGLPVTAWLLLPKEEGYWFNLDNAPQAAARCAAFRRWSSDFGLTWKAIGMDIEPDINALRRLSSGGLRGLARFLRQANPRRLAAGREIYAHLVRDFQTEGYTVEAYQFAFIVDERRAGSRLVQRLTGVLDLPVDREVLMLYSSFWPKIGSGLLWSYGCDAGGIGLGSTGGGVTIEGLVATAPLDWPALRRDLLQASRMNAEVYVFSLEGCVMQDFLSRIATLEWDASLALPEAQARSIGLLRAVFRAVLRISRLFV